MEDEDSSEDFSICNKNSFSISGYHKKAILILNGFHSCQNAQENPSNKAIILSNEQEFHKIKFEFI